LSRLDPFPVMRIQVIIEDESGLTTTAEIAAIERRLSTDLIGISLEEAKAMTGSVQRVMVETQAREAIDRGSRCPECQLRLRPVLERVCRFQ
jgi:hypothetical protein